MVELDRTLTENVQQFVTGANIHRIKTLLFMYQESVNLHNSGHLRHAEYHHHYEDLLREFVRLLAWP
jgi:hypothetical protein